VCLKDRCWFHCNLSFVICDLDGNLGGMIRKFADDTKIGGIVDSKEGFLGLQWDLGLLGQCVDEWQMEFNLDQCDMMDLVDRIGTGTSCQK